MKIILRATVVVLGVLVYLAVAEAHRFHPSQSTRKRQSHNYPSIIPRGGSDDPFQQQNPDWEQHATITATRFMVPPNEPNKPTFLADLDDYPSPTATTKPLLQLPTLQLDSFQAFCQSFQNYLQQLARNHPDLFAVAAASVAVFGLWQTMRISPLLQSLLQNHFVCRKELLQKGRYHVLVLSAVSHISIWHLLFNLVSFLSLGPSVKQALLQQQSLGLYNTKRRNSKASLWRLFLGAATVGSLAHALLGHRDGSLGLSSVTMAMVALLARLNPDRVVAIRLMGVFPVRLSGQLLLQILLVWSAVGSFNRRSEKAHISHLAGLLFGIVYYELHWGRSLDWFLRGANNSGQRKSFLQLG